MSSQPGHIQNPQQKPPGTKREGKLSNLLDPWYKQATFIGWMFIAASVSVIQLIIFFLYMYFGEEGLIDSFLQSLEWLSVGLISFAGMVLFLKLFLSGLDKFGLL